MLSLVFLGFLIGMRHALEADHVAAVATLATRSSSFQETVKQGAAWGLGHTLTLFLFGSIVFLVDSVVPETLAHKLEMAVAVMLVVLGADVIRRVIRDRIHFHTHSHSGKEVHFHAHSHRGEKQHGKSTHDHDHEHKQTFPMRALLVGLMHGMAGSAALILLTLETIQSPLLGLLYIALFGIGSMLGMAVLSFIIAIPLRTTAGQLTWLHNIFEILIGVFTTGLGLGLLFT